MNTDSGWSETTRFRPERRLMPSILLVSIGVLLAGAFFWANATVVDKVTRGQGKVIPSSRLQVVQNLEGGILSAMFVEEGDTVVEGAVLAELDSTIHRSHLGELQSTYDGLLAKEARLRAQAELQETFVPPKELVARAPRIIASEQELFLARQSNLLGEAEVLEKELERRLQELAEKRNEIVGLRIAVELANDEMAITAPMVQKGVAAEIDLVRLKRDIADHEARLSLAIGGIKTLQASVGETERKISQVYKNFQADARETLTSVSVDISTTIQSLQSYTDQVRRTQITAPTAGVVKSIIVPTIGGVLQPGSPLMEIVPNDPSLLIETKIKPSEIGFIHADQRVLVKMSAYDFSIYGGLEGELVLIRPDTVQDEQGVENYIVHVQTDRNYLTKDEDILRVIPGMLAEVDIITGEHSIMEYMAKPILRGWQRAFTER